MQSGQDTIPIGVGSAGAAADLKTRFPGAVAFVETFDSDEDDAESTDIFSFEALREAFSTIQSAESALAQTIPAIEFSADRTLEVLAGADYGIDDTMDDDTLGLEDACSSPASRVETPAARLETIIEAMLFVGNRENQPLGAEQIAEKLRNVSVEDVDQAAGTLNRHYQDRQCPYTIVSERGGYRMVLRSEFESVRANFYGKTREARLSQQAIDTLAIAAYRQPVTAEEIQNLRQQPCSAVLSQLVRRKLLSTSREVQGKKSVVYYHTTPRFLELFKIKSLDEIPKADELD